MEGDQAIVSGEVVNTTVGYDDVGIITLEHGAWRSDGGRSGHVQSVAVMPSAPVEVVLLPDSAQPRRELPDLGVQLEFVEKIDDEPVFHVLDTDGERIAILRDAVAAGTWWYWLVEDGPRHDAPSWRQAVQQIVDGTRLAAGDHQASPDTEAGLAEPTVTSDPPSSAQVPQVEHPDADTPSRAADSDPQALLADPLHGQASDRVAAGHLLLQAVTGAGLTTRIREHVERVIASPPGQVWAVDGDGAVWALPAAAEVQLVAVPPERRPDLDRLLIHYHDASSPSPPVETDIPEHLETLTRALVDQGFVVGLESPANLPDSDDSQGARGWLVRFMRSGTERVFLTVADDQLRVVEAFVQVLDDRSGPQTERWLNLPDGEVRAVTAPEELIPPLMAAPAGSDRRDTPNPLASAGEGEGTDHTDPGVTQAPAGNRRRGVQPDRAEESAAAARPVDSGGRPTSPQRPGPGGFDSVDQARAHLRSGGDPYRSDIDTPAVQEDVSRLRTDAQRLSQRDDLALAGRGAFLVGRDRGAHAQFVDQGVVGPWMVWHARTGRVMGIGLADQARAIEFADRLVEIKGADGAQADWTSPLLGDRYPGYSRAVSRLQSDLGSRRDTPPRPQIIETTEALEQAAAYLLWGLGDEEAGRAVAQVSELLSESPTRGDPDGRFRAASVLQAAMTKEQRGREGATFAELVTALQGAGEPAERKSIGGRLAARAGQISSRSIRSERREAFRRAVWTLHNGFLPEAADTLTERWTAADDLLARLVSELERRPDEQQWAQGLRDTMAARVEQAVEFVQTVTGGAPAAGSDGAAPNRAEEGAGADAKEGTEQFEPPGQGSLFDPAGTAAADSQHQSPSVPSRGESRAGHSKGKQKGKAPGGQSRMRSQALPREDGSDERVRPASPPPLEDVPSEGIREDPESGGVLRSDRSGSGEASRPTADDVGQQGDARGNLSREDRPAEDGQAPSGGGRDERPAAAAGGGDRQRDRRGRSSGRAGNAGAGEYRTERDHRSGAPAVRGDRRGTSEAEPRTLSADSEKPASDAAPADTASADTEGSREPAAAPAADAAPDSPSQQDRTVDAGPTSDAAPHGEHSDETAAPAPAQATPAPVQEPDAPSEAGGGADAAPEWPRFRPSSQDDLAPATPKLRLESNLAALRTLRAIQAAGRPPTGGEQQILARWSGWGAIPQVFDEREEIDGKPGPGVPYAQTRAELRDLLGEEGYAAARLNTLNAHYTDAGIVQALWNAVGRLGFNGGLVLEPGCGSGNFIGFAPGGSQVIGVELDPVTADIAAMLYPDARILKESFADTRVRSGTFDLAIGNVPFGKVALTDRRHNRGGHSIHDHFAIKSLDLVREGGLVAVVTSRWTMDSQNPKVRREMAQLGTLVGAVRLPSGAHQQAAGTKVVTDILIFRAGPPPKDKPVPAWEMTQTVTLGDVKVPINEYFVHHPGHVLGELGTRHGAYSAEDLTVTPTGDLTQELENALAEIVDRAGAQGLRMEPRGEEAAPALAALVSVDDEEEGHLDRLDDGSFTQIVGGAVQHHPVPRTQAAELADLLGLRDTARRLLQLEAAVHDENSPEIDRLRDQLNSRYDAYLAAYGPINRFTWSARIRSNDAGESLRRQLLADGHAHLTGGTFTLPATPDGLALRQELLDQGHATTAKGKWRLRNTAAARAIRDRLVAEGRGTIEGARITLTDEGRAIVEKRAKTDEEAVNLVATYPAQGGFRADPYAPLVYALEKFDPTDQRATKAEIFTERVVAPRKPPLSADTPEDALAISLDLRGHADLDEIGRLLGVPPEDAYEQLGDLVFHDPQQSGRLVPAAEYLSGNVRAKLEVAREAAIDLPDLERNIEALTKVIPPDLQPDEIDARLGAPWIGAPLVQQWLREILQDPSARVEHAGGSYWGVQGDDSTVLAYSTWGTDRYPAPDLVQTILEQRPIRVTDNIGTKKEPQYVLNIDATAAAMEKADELHESFSEWCWSDPERATRLARRYNLLFNGTVLRSYDDAKLSLPGLAEHFKPHPHQYAAVARMVHEPAVLLAHEVGAGKTAEMAMGVMELRRLGLVRKPAMVVPNHMLEQFQREFLQLYPQAKLLVATKDDLSTKKRRAFVAKCATGDWDAVIIAHSSFEKIPMSVEAQLRYLKQEAIRFDLMIARVTEQQGKGEKSLTVKRLEAAKKRALERMKKKMDTLKDPGVTFEQTGIDYLVVDEAHLFKNLRTPSSIPDAAIDGSNRATDLDMKIEFLRDRNGERVVTLATATPIANSLTEANVMQRYTRPDLLRAAGLTDFDSWAATFGEVTVAIEFSPDGNGFRQKGRFAKFINVPEMLKMWHLSADIKTAEDLGLPVPDIAEREDGKREPETVIVDPSDEQLLYIAELGERAEDIRNRKVEPWQDNMLKVSGDGRKAALDMRMVRPDATSDQPTKIEIAADRIASIWEEHRDRVYLDTDGQPHPVPGALQLVFSDIGTPTGEGWNAYDELKQQLVDRGMPAEKIRFIHEARNDREKGELFAACRSGRVSVLIGSTEKMGVGTNVQARAVALHHLDCPWRPADLQQREGRILRQGNQHRDMGIPIQILRYVTQRTFDAYMWQGVTRKAKFIGQVMRGRLDVREMEDIGQQSLSFDEVKALATGNPLLIDLAEAQAALTKLQRRERAHKRSQDLLRNTVDASARRITETTAYIGRIDEAIARRKDTAGEKFHMNVQGVEFTARADAGKRLIKIVQDQALVVQSTEHSQQKSTVGEIGGFPVTVSASRTLGRTSIWLSLKDAPDADIYIKPSEIKELDPTGVVNRLENRLARFEKVKQNALADIARCKVESQRAQGDIGKPFAHAEELEAAEKKLNDLNRQLAELAREVPNIDLDEVTGAGLLGAAGAHGLQLENSSRLAFELGDGRNAYIQTQKGERPYLVVVEEQNMVSATVEDLRASVCVLAGETSELDEGTIAAIQQRIEQEKAAREQAAQEQADKRVAALLGTAPAAASSAGSAAGAGSGGAGTGGSAGHGTLNPALALKEAREKLQEALEQARAAMATAGNAPVSYTAHEDVEHAAEKLRALSSALSRHLDSRAEEAPDHMVTAFDLAYGRIEAAPPDWSELARRFEALEEATLDLARGEGIARTSVYAFHAQELRDLIYKFRRGLEPYRSKSLTEIEQQGTPYDSAAQIIEGRGAVAQAWTQLLEDARDGVPKSSARPLRKTINALVAAIGAVEGGVQQELNRYIAIVGAAEELAGHAGTLGAAAFGLWAQSALHEANLRAGWEKHGDAFGPMLREASKAPFAAPATGNSDPDPAANPPVWLEHNRDRTILHIRRGEDPELDKLAKGAGMVYSPSQVKAWKFPSPWKWETRHAKTVLLGKRLSLLGHKFDMGRRRTDQTIPAPKPAIPDVSSEFVLPDGLPFETLAEAHGAFKELSTATATFQETPAWEQMKRGDEVDRHVHALAAAFDLSHAVDPRIDRAERILAAYTHLAESVRQFQQGLQTKDAQSQAFDDAINDLERTAITFASRLNATATGSPAQWAAIFRTPPPGPRPARAEVPPTNRDPADTDPREAVQPAVTEPAVPPAARRGKAALAAAGMPGGMRISSNGHVGTAETPDASTGASASAPQAAERPPASVAPHTDNGR